MYSSRPRNDPHFSSCRPQNHSQLSLGIEWYPWTMDQAKRFLYATRSNSLMVSILDQFELDFSKLYRQIDLFASDSLIFLSKNYLQSSHYKNHECSHCFFLSFSFLPPRSFFFSFLFPSLLWFWAYRAQKTCLNFTQMTAEFVRLVFKKLGWIYIWLNLCKHCFSECLHMSLVPRIPPSPPRTPSNCLRLPLSCATVVSRGLIQLSRAK